MVSVFRDALFFLFDERNRAFRFWIWDCGFWILREPVNTRNKTTLIVLVTALLLGSGCRVDQIGSPERAAVETTRIVRDDLGREVRVPLKIERAVSLAPNLTEMIFAVGAGDRLVGVTTYCNYPAEAQAIQKVSDTQTPNIESIIALQPQVVFVSTASQLEAFMRTLDERGIAVFVTNAASLDDVFRHIHLFGELFGTRERAGNLRNDLQERVASVRAGLDGQPRIRVFVQISKEPLFTIGRDSFLTEVIEIAGAESVTADVPSGYPKLSKETATALNRLLSFCRRARTTRSRTMRSGNRKRFATASFIG